MKRDYIPRKFNSVGPIIPSQHFMIDITTKLNKIEELIDAEVYLIMNSPRLTGKTTFLNQLCKKLRNKYIVISINFESISNDYFRDSRTFFRTLINLIGEYLTQDEELISQYKNVNYMYEMREFIKRLTLDKNIILMIDNSDKIFSNKIYLEFLGLLKSLYLDREDDLATTFKSVILAGICNSPWSIAETLDLPLEFSTNEIKTMLIKFNYNNNGILKDINDLSKCLFNQTNGHPFLISCICEIIDEKIVGYNKRNWTIDDITQAIKILLSEDNNLFNNLINDLENNIKLQDLLKDKIINKKYKIFNIDNYVTNTAYSLGYINRNDYCYISISNTIINKYLSSYFISNHYVI